MAVSQCINACLCARYDEMHFMHCELMTEGFIASKVTSILLCYKAGRGSSVKGKPGRIATVMSERVFIAQILTCR